MRLIVASFQLIYTSSVAARLDSAHTSSPGPFHSITHALKFRNDPIPLIALNLNPSILDRSASAKPLLQLGGKFREAVLVQGQVGDDCHPLASPALRLSAHSDDGGLARGRWLAPASACGL